MQNRASSWILSATLFLLTVLFILPSIAQQATFRNAPASAAADKNPYAGSASAAAAAGKQLYAKDCAQCHGANLQGMGPAPALDTPSVRSAKPGELLWFITTGKLSSGMPSWANLSVKERWQIVTFLDSRPATKTATK